jgi:hypothetical protein
MNSEVEVSSWFLGVVYGGISALAIAAGVLSRRVVFPSKASG